MGDFAGVRDPALLRHGYKEIKVIGQGSFGSCSHVVREQDGVEFVAKKICIADMSEEEKQGSMTEVNVLRRLQHPNIIQYEESFIEGQHLYIIMEHAAGGDLHHAISSQRKEGRDFSEERIVMWFLQIAGALGHVHSLNILHRDLKTQNIFLDKNERIKLGDFGIARILQSDTELAKTVIGTPYYLSPELCEGKPYNKQSDVWALGCVLYELTTLKRSFDGKNLPALILKILKGNYVPVPEKYSPALRDLIKMMLMKKPSSRPTIDSILRSFEKQGITVDKMLRGGSKPGLEDQRSERKREKQRHEKKVSDVDRLAEKFGELESSMAQAKAAPESPAPRRYEHVEESPSRPGFGALADARRNKPPSYDVDPYAHYPSPGPAQHQTPERGGNAPKYGDLLDRFGELDNQWKQQAKPGGVRRAVSEQAPGKDDPPPGPSNQTSTPGRIVKKKVPLVKKKAQKQQDDYDQKMLEKRMEEEKLQKQKEARQEEIAARMADRERKKLEQQKILEANAAKPKAVAKISRGQKPFGRAAPHGEMVDAMEAIDMKEKEKGTPSRKKSEPEAPHVDMEAHKQKIKAAKPRIQLKQMKPFQHVRREEGEAEDETNSGPSRDIPVEIFAAHPPPKRGGGAKPESDMAVAKAGISFDVDLGGKAKRTPSKEKKAAKKTDVPVEVHVPSRPVSSNADLEGSLRRAEIAAANAAAKKGSEDWAYLNEMEDRTKMAEERARSDNLNLYKDWVVDRDKRLEKAGLDNFAPPADPYSPHLNDDGVSSESWQSAMKNVNRHRGPSMDAGDDKRSSEDRSGRIESLRQECEKALGDEVFLKAYRLLRSQQDSDGDDTLDNELKKILGSSGIQYARQINQLIYCEDQVFG